MVRLNGELRRREGAVTIRETATRCVTLLVSQRQSRPDVVTWLVPVSGGAEIVRRAHGLGMRVLATRNSSREGPEFVACVGLPAELHARVAQAAAAR